MDGLLLRFRKEVTDANTAALDTLPLLATLSRSPQQRALFARLEDHLRDFEFDETGIILDQLEALLRPHSDPQVSS